MRVAWIDLKAYRQSKKRRDSTVWHGATQIEKKKKKKKKKKKTERSHK